MRHDRGLAASPPIRYRLKVAGECVPNPAPPASPSARQPLRVYEPNASAKMCMAGPDVVEPMSGSVTETTCLAGFTGT
jgi:hypothetical protein